MGRSLLKISIVVLSLLIASASAAEEVIQNGGFESGELFPWEEVGDHAAWSVTNSYAYNGAYSALVRGTHQLAQSFEPRPGSNIEVFSLAVMTALRAWITVEILYTDSMGPTRATLFIPAGLQWLTLDLLEYVDPDREVYGVALSGHQNGDSPDDMRTWYDAVTIQNNGPDEADDPPEVEADEAIQAETKKIRVHFNLKRPRTQLSLALRAEELPEGIYEGPVEIKVLLTQDGFTTAFEAEAELVDVPHRRDHVIRLMDQGSADKVKGRH